MGDPRIETARKLFEAWSSGDADAPAPYLTEDAVLHDIVGGTHTGWPDIRAFFAAGLKHWPDLVLLPDEYWTNERGVALRWVMSATVTDERFGPEANGKKWSSDGMTWLVFENDGAGPRVCHEVDYHDSGAVTKSLGLPPRR